MAHWGTSLSDEAHQLRYLSRSGNEQILSFAGRADLKIGASPECDLVLDGPGVAPQHCRIEARKGRLLLFDRGSSAGTLINDRRCSEPTTLREGDRIAIGDHLLEVLPGRAHLDEEAIAEHLSFSAPGWSSGEATRQMNFMRLLGQDAAAWEARQRPSRLLLKGERLERAASLERRLPDLHAWLEASAARRRRIQGLRWWLAGLIPGLLVGLLVSWPVFFKDNPAGREDVSVAKPPPAQRPSVATHPRCTVYEIQPDERETLQDVASDARVDVQHLAEDNRLDPSAPPPLGPLKTCTSRPPVRRVSHAHRVEVHESWESLARHYQLPLDRLRRYNPRIAARELRAGDAIELMVDPDLIRTRKPRPEIEIPTGAESVNRPQDGETKRAILLQQTDFFDIRCPRHAYGASSAVAALTRAIRRLREHYNYHGQIIIGDLSKEDGGEFGEHLSHKSGRDIDIWLPIKSGAYRLDRLDPSCNHCQTNWCKVQEKEIDWDATLLLLRALHDTGQVQQIFLKFPSKIRSRARKTAAGDAVAKVKYMGNHRHHLHVRFKCGEEDSSCRN